MELSTQTMASSLPDANPISDLVPNLPIHREEGELSSADDDENHDVSPPASVGIADPSARADPTPQEAGILQGNQEERLNLGNPSSKSVTVVDQTSQLNYEKTSGNSQIQHKAVPPKIGVPKDNNNLVISFSDDESSSDSDENWETRHLKSKGRIDGVYNNQKSSTLTTQVLQKFGEAPTKENQRISKQMSLSRKLAPLLPKHPGVGNRKDGIVSIGRGSLSRNFTANRRLGNQELGYDYVVGSRNHKLQDLRQQIAIRENELKRKSADLNKQSASGSNRDSAALRVNRDLARKHQLKSADAREPDSFIPKRLKVDVPSFAQKNLEVHLLPSKCISAPKELMLETGNKGVVDGWPKTSPTGVAQRRIVRWKNKDTEKAVAGASDLNSNKQAGTKIIAVDRGTGTSVDPCPLSNQSLPTHRVTPNALPNSSGGLDSAILWNSLGKTSASENVNLEIQSLTEMEESIDKELEDAQEYRRRCEIEERNALKAYCKAQRVLIEANLRCTHLYRQRELYSSRLRSFIMDDSFLFGSSNGQDYLMNSSNRMNSSNNMSENLNLMPSSSNHLQSEHDQFNQLGYARNIQGANGATFSSSFDHANGQNIGSEPCSEPDASTSEPLPVTGRTLVHGESSPSNGRCISGDEDEEYFACDGKQSKQNVQRQRTHSTASGQDSLLLEATLRSELFARFGMKSKQNSSSLLNTRSTVEQRSENDIGSEKNQVSNSNVPISESERTEHSSEEGSDREDGDVLEASIHLKHQSHAEKSLEPHTSHEDEDNKYTEGCYKSLICSTYNLRSAFHHVKSKTQFGITESHKQFREYDFCADDNAAAGSANEGTFSTNLAEHTYIDLFETVASSYSCDAPVDPILPLCMYELRGKCNNDECPWQHIRDLSIRKMSQHDSDATECQVEPTPNGERTLPTKHPKCHTPTYLVGLDTLKTNAHTYDSVVAPSVGKCWQKGFSICLAGSNFLRQVLNADDSILQNNDGRVELFGCWTNQSSYFRDRNCRMNELSESPIDDGQSLESALLLLNQEDDKLEGKKKALSVLSRALEVNPTSVVLWIVYLVFFYIKAWPAETDDLYSVSVKHNQASYELWLMYINSRTKLEDRLAAYDEAISALTNHSSASSEDNQTHTSSCILDLFLQMTECLCMSGNVERALEIISSKEGSSTLLSNIVSCLTISDKCVFWVCCVYLVVYRRLPDAIVHQLECEKELLMIEWAPVHLTDEEMRKAFELLDSVKSDFEKEESLAAHSFALSHIRCSIAVNGVERSRDLLDRYVKMYPTCLELVLMSARLENLDFEDLSFHGFENALSKWPNGSPGSQCIWNQYAECALQNNKADFAKELMQRWFGIHGDESMDTDSESSSNLDKVYGFLNLSLHRLLQQQNKEANEAMDLALKAAANPKTYMQCVTEHALFMVKPKPRTEEMLDLLNSYVSDLRAFPVSEPLSRKFIADVKKPRVQQLIRNNILCPVSNSFLLVNSVLETWFGLSLLPYKVGKVKDLVDFVEGVMEISPSNYPLAISICKVIISREWDTAPSLAFWASSVLVRSLSHTVPIPPEFVWVEAVTVLGAFSGIDTIMEGLYQKALSVHPCSVKLCKSYYRDVGRKSKGDAGLVLEAAREKGIELGVE